MTMRIEELAMYSMVFASAGCATAATYPALSDAWRTLVGTFSRFQRGKVEQATRELGDLFVEARPSRLKLAYGIGPLLVGLLLLLLMDNVFLACGGVIVSAVIPDVLIRKTKALRKRRFETQLVDTLFLLSSSLRAGLSLLQALETIEEEMGPPMSQEMGLVVKAHRVGVSLEEALEHLNKRMASEELNLAVTALLLARSTGGDVTKVVDQLVTTIREKKKLSDRVNTLTLQGRLQAYIMSFLPVFFAYFVRTFNPRYFDILLTDPVGNGLIALVFVLWVVGMFLLFRMSRVEV